MRYRRLAFLMLVFWAVCAQSCALVERHELKEYKEIRSFFSTYVSIHCYCGENVEIIDIVRECWQRISQIQSSMDAHSKESDVARINSDGFNGVEVNKDIYDILKQSAEISKLSKGAFDITVLPLLEVWKQAEKQNCLPDERLLESAKNKVGYRYIRLDKNKVFFKKEGTRIDLGAVAKGYAVDEVAKILDNHNIKHFLIDAGGDIFCRGKDEGKVPWRVGIQHPDEKEGIFDILNISNAAVTTSGNYARFYSIGGEKFSHIIDPISGFPQQDVISVTVIAPTAKDADALSTALSVMGGERGLRLIETLKDTEAVVIEKKQGKAWTYKTRGYEAYR